MDSLVSTDWLAPAIGDGDLVVLDATYHLPGSGRDARAEYMGAHIPGARFFDIPALSDPATELPTMLPSAEVFATGMEALGVGDGDRIVIYDSAAHHSSARAWWMLEIFGARHVALLDGGIAKWRAEGRALESGAIPFRPAHFTPHLNPALLRDMAAMRANVASGAEQVLDARSAGRFTGAEPDLRPHIPSGHIPGSRNLPYGGVFNADGTWKRGDALRVAFEGAGIDLERPVITTCGSGITAAILAFGLHLLGKSDIALYDGSWTEWGADPSTPKAVGAA
jgi:thiosulfate/3-mercaptopyruvate sulfurtransferase